LPRPPISRLEPWTRPPHPSSGFLVGFPFRSNSRKPLVTWCAPGDSNHPTCGLRIRCSTVELGAQGNHMNTVEGSQAVSYQPGTGCWPLTPIRCISGSVVCRDSGWRNAGQPANCVHLAIRAKRHLRLQRLRELPPKSRHTQRSTQPRSSWSYPVPRQDLPDGAVLLASLRMRLQPAW